MQKHSDTITDLKGNVITNASVRITTLAGALATIYTDDNGTLAANPVPVDDTGRFAFYAANGRYSREVFVGGVSYAVLSDLLLDDPEEATFSAGANATPRSVQARLREIPSVSDYASLEAAFLDHDCVRIPSGVTVTLTANFTPTRAGLTIIGEGRDSVIAFSGNDRRIHLTKNNFTLQNLTIDGGKPTVGWETTNNYDFGLRVGEGVSSRVKGLRVRGVVFKNIGMDAILLSNCEDVIIDDDCEFINCRRWGVVIEPGLYGVEQIYVGGYYDCDYAGGPVGKETPLGAIDCEPYDIADGAVNNITYGNIRSNKGEVALITSGGAITSAFMNGVKVSNGTIAVTNCTADISAAHIIGANGYFNADIGADGATTQARKLDITFNTGRTPVRTTTGGRDNLVGCDFGNETFLNVASSISGSGSSSGYIKRIIDGRTVYLREMVMTAALGEYALRDDLDCTITAGDQVFIFIEIERTDANSPNNNFFKVALGGGVLLDRAFLPPIGVSTFIAGFKAGSTVVNPRLTYGLSGTAGAAVSALARKCFVLVNPLSINTESLKVRPNTSAGITDNATAPAVTITSGGFVGIGDTAPTFQQVVASSLTGVAEGDNTALQLLSKASGRDINMRLGDGTNPSVRYGQLSGVAYIYTSGAVRVSISLGGNLSVLTAGAGLRVKEGSNAKQGVSTLVAGTVTVANTSVTASSRIFLTGNSDGGTPGFLRVSARVVGTSFTITSSNAADTGTVAWEIFEPA